MLRLNSEQVSSQHYVVNESALATKDVNEDLRPIAIQRNNPVRKSSA